MRSDPPAGQFYYAEPLLLGQGRICLADRTGVHQEWMYEHYFTACVMLAVFLAEDEQEEPDGWRRHMPSGRRAAGAQLIIHE